ncbi:MAG: hypothetical protein ACI9G1_003069, partial [Pirellulaceae bacterium]
MVKKCRRAQEMSARIPLLNVLYPDGSSSLEARFDPYEVGCYRA